MVKNIQKLIGPAFFVIVLMTQTILHGQDNPFIIEIDTELEVTQYAEIKFSYNGAYLMYKWESIDGKGHSETVELNSDVDVRTIQFPEEGKYRIEFRGLPSGPGSTGNIEYINITENYRKMLTKITQWGDIGWTSFNFDGAEKLKISATDIPNLTGVTSLMNSFRDTGIDVVPNINDWDVSNVTTMYGVFHGASLFNSDIGGWKVDEVEDMMYMFFDATAFNQDLSDWNVGKVKRMYGMFRHASSFNGNISNWDVSKVEDMGWMFYGAYAFNQDLHWDTESVTDMGSMFSDQLDQGEFEPYGHMKFNGDISGWDVSNVVDMSEMFLAAKDFNQDISGWKVGEVTNMAAMFAFAESFDQDISGWDVSEVTNMAAMFAFAESFNQDISGWDVSNVTSMHTIFYGAAAFNQNLSTWELNELIHDPSISQYPDGFPFKNDVSFFNSNMSCENYSRTLKAWAHNPNIAESIMLDVGEALFSPAVESDMDFLIDKKGWSIKGEPQIGDVSHFLLGYGTLKVSFMMR